MRSTVWSMPAICVMALNSTAAAANDAKNPAAMNAGRALPLPATDAPSKAGRTGSVHGAAMVNIPAKSAKATAVM